MECELSQKLMASYWDLSIHDSRKSMIDRHILTCQTCASKFQIWKKTISLVRTSQMREEAQPEPHQYKISSMVMQRIYQAESWRRPVPDKQYVMSSQRKSSIISIILTAFMICLISFFLSAINGSPLNLVDSSDDIFNIHAPQTHPVAVYEESVDGTNLVSAVAGVSESLIEPRSYTSVIAHTSLSYLFIVSLFGLIFNSLLLNWFIRIRSE